MNIKNGFLLCMLALIVISCSGGSDGDSSYSEQNQVSVLYADLSNYDLKLPYNPSDNKIFSASGESIVTMALGLKIPDTAYGVNLPVVGVTNLDLSFELYIGDDSAGYPLYPIGELTHDTLTVDEITPDEPAHLAIPLFIGKEAYEALDTLTEATECRIKIAVDPYKRQAELTPSSKEISVMFLPQILFDTPPSGQDKTTPPYKNRFFDDVGYNKVWGIPSIATLHTNLAASATWEPMDSFPTIPYAVGLICQGDIIYNIFGSNCQLLKTALKVNANLNHLTQSGYDASLILLGYTMFNESARLGTSQLVLSWAPRFAVNIDPKTVEKELWISALKISVSATISGTMNANLPGNIDFSSRPWRLNQNFTPDVKATLASTITTSNTPYGVTAPITLTDSQLRFSLSGAKINPQIPNVHAKMEWPGDYTILKGSIHITKNGKTVWKVYEYAVIDINVIKRQGGYIHANSNGIDVYLGEYKEQTPRVN